MRCETIALAGRFAFLGENGRAPALTAYLPEPLHEMGRSEWKRPGVLVLPGGGYGMCSQREAEPIAVHFLPEGYNVFVLHYSTKPATFPVQIREVAAAMELIAENQEIWHCDIQRMAIIGFSAGGHLAAHYTNCYDIPEVREVFAQSKPVQASILCYPVITADPVAGHMESFQNLLGVQQLTRHQQNQFSCERMVTKRTPPTFLWHTASDNVVPVENSLRYASALAACDVPFSLHIYPAGEHGLSTVDATTCEALPESVLYARQWLTDLKIWLKNTLR